MQFLYNALGLIKVLILFGSNKFQLILFTYCLAGLSVVEGLSCLIYQHITYSVPLLQQKHPCMFYIILCSCDTQCVCVMSDQNLNESNQPRSGTNPSFIKYFLVALVQIIQSTGAKERDRVAGDIWTWKRINITLTLSYSHSDKSQARPHILLSLFHQN